MVYTFSETKELIKKSIPQDVDNNIVIRALIELTNSRMTLKDIKFFENYLALFIPEGMEIKPLIIALMQIMVKTSLRYTKSNRIIAGIENLSFELFGCYMANLIFLAKEDESWKSSHFAEINKIIFSEEKSELFTPEVKQILRQEFENYGK